MPRGRVLLLTQPADGGVFEHVTHLAGGLRERGWEPVVCGPVLDTWRDPHVEVVPLPMERAVSPRADLLAAGRLAQVVRRLRPAVVHAHSSKAGAVARVARAAFPRTPVVYTPHGYAFAGWFEDEAERRRYRRVERALAPLATRVIGVCEAERRLAASVGPEGRTRVVHNGVGPTPVVEPHPALGPLRARGPLLGAVARLSPGKGVETLVAAMPRVLAAHPHATLVVAGDGPLRPEVEAQMAEHGVSHAVHLLGTTPGSAAVVRGLDLFVNPSWAESFPYSVLEAMRMGLPVVATDVGGTGEAITHGATGVLVPPRDPAALAHALVDLLADPARAARLGEGARRCVEERFTLDAMVEGTLGVYAELGP